ncbi:MAG TPA: ADOP family duplicated permease [Vicinamibacterales bacterium]|nr:ADOP family duplicated permease [Vicinamibacterales bacterium]
MRRLLVHPLTWLTDRPLAESIVGDLEELRARRGGGAIFFWRSALGILAHALGVRLREAAAAVRTSRGGSRGAGGDLRHALRGLGRNPVFAVSAILLLALGIGANTVVFSVVHAVVLRPLPYHAPDRLVYVWGGTDHRPGNRHPILTGQHVLEIGRVSTTLESYAIAKSWDTTIDGEIDLLSDTGSERLRGAFVTPNLFDLLGVTPRLGRTFSSADADARIAVISSGLWKRRFGGDQGVIGAQVRLASGRAPRTEPPYTIVGVLPDEVRFTYPRDTEIFLLLPWPEIRPNRALQYAMLARLKPGVEPSQAEAEITAALRNVTRGYTNIPPQYMPEMLQRTQALVEPMLQHVSAEVRPGLTLVWAVAAIVLVIACINLGLLMLARTIDRTSELAVRAALGAGPRRLLRLLAVEGLVLAGAGGVAGVAVAAAVLPAVQSLLPEIVPRTDLIRLSLPVLLFALGVTSLTALVCGVTPALLTQRRDLLVWIRRSGGAHTGAASVLRWRGAIVGVQVAVVLVLLVAASLLLHSFWRLQRVPLGFEARDVLTLETRLYNPKYRGARNVAAFEAELLARVRNLPGVERASISTAVPMRGVDFTFVVGPVGGKPRPGQMRSVDPDYFEVLGIRLLAGRLFTEDDRAGSPRVMVVSEAYGHQHFGSESPLGRRIDIDDAPVEIIGVVSDVRYATVAGDPAPAFYLPRAQQPSDLICLLVKPRPGMQAAVAEGLRHVVTAIDPEQPARGLTTLAALVSDSTADRRLYAFASGAFAAVALLLAVAGLFGIVSRAVTERRRELAIRAAVGADASRLLRLVLGYGLLPVLAGSVAGLVAAAAAARLLRAFLFEITATDPASYAAAAVVVVAAAALACLRPAWRAARLQPMAVLRNE